MIVASNNIYELSLEMILNEGIKSFYLNNYNKAIHYFNTSLEQANCLPRQSPNNQEINVFPKSFIHTIRKANNHELKSFKKCNPHNLRFDEGFHTFSNVLEPSQSTDIILILYFNIGKCYQRLNMYSDAIEYYFNALIEAEERPNEFHVNDTLTILAILNGIGQINVFHGDFGEAFGIYNVALDLSRSKLGHVNILSASALNCIAVLLFQMESTEYDTIAKLLEESLEIQRSLLGNFHQDTATSLNNLGRVYYTQGRMVEALTVYQESFTIRKRVYGSNHFDMASIEYNLGLLYQKIGEPQKALLYFNEFLRIFRYHKIFVDTDVSNILLCIGQIYHHDFQDYQQAQKAYEEALGIELNLSGDEENAQIASIINKLGNVYFETGEFEMASMLYQQGLNIEVKIHGMESANVVVTLINIAELHKQRKDFNAALDIYKQAWKIQKKVLPEHHSDVFITLSNIAFLLYHKGDHNKAIKMYMKALDIKKTYSKDLDGDTASILSQIGSIYLKLQRFQDALESFISALNIQQSLCDNERDMALNFYNVARVHEQLQNYSLALSYYERALQIEIQELGPDHQDVSMTLYHMGQVHFESGEFSEAINKFEDAIEIQIQIHGRFHAAVAKIFNCMGNAYLKKGDYAKAMESFIQVSRIYRETGVDVTGNMNMVAADNVLQAIDIHDDLVAPAA